jgi:3-oxoadipate enol-lactonase
MSLIDVDGTRLHYLVEGPEDAPAIAFLNSLGSDVGMWDPQVEALRSRFRIVRHDSRGHGASDAPEGPYSIEQLGGDVVSLLDALEIERVHLCGVSMGGLVALWMAATHSERTERAIFASTAVKIGSKDFWDERARAVEAGGMKAIRETVIERFLTSSFREASPRMAREVEATLESTPPDGYVASCLAVRDADLTGTVGSIRAPSLIIAGAEDVATPPSDAEKLHEHIPGSELVVLEDASHLCNLEQPERFNETVLRFLGSGREVGRRHP